MLHRWPLVGREGELAELKRLASGAAQGRGALVLLAGEAGIGKTALVESLIEQSDGALLVARGWCPGAVETPPYGPWLDLVPDLAGQTGSGRSALPQPFGPVPAGEGGHWLAEALLDWLSAVGGPVLLVLEDIHWADPASLELLRYLSLRVHRAPLLVVATYRPAAMRPSDLSWRILSDLQRTVALRLELERLDLAAVHAMTEIALPNPPLTGRSPGASSNEPGDTPCLCVNCWRRRCGPGVPLGKMCPSPRPCSR